MLHYFKLECGDQIQKKEGRRRGWQSSFFHPPRLDIVIEQKQEYLFSPDWRQTFTNSSLSFLAMTMRTKKMEGKQLAGSFTFQRDFSPFNPPRVTVAHFLFSHWEENSTDWTDLGSKKLNGMSSFVCRIWSDKDI